MRGHESAAGGQQKEEHLQLPKGQVSDTLNRHPEARKARGTLLELNMYERLSEGSRGLCLLHSLGESLLVLSWNWLPKCESWLQTNVAFQPSCLPQLKPREMREAAV